MKEILTHLFEQKSFSKLEAKKILTDLALGKYNNSQMAAFMTAFSMRSIRVEELEGFREAMLELCIPLDLQEYDLIDLCGTGGDGKDTFNISTISSFVVAGAGYKVAKHGNYGVSSISGSSNVLEELGYTFTKDTDKLKKSLDVANICFLHAPLFHPAMKTVAPIRKELGVKTFFNMLGPMVNPASPGRQVVGVFSLELARLYAYFYQKTAKTYAIIHATDGYDEITLSCPFKVFSKTGESYFSHSDLGLHKTKPVDLLGAKTVKEAAELALKIINGEGTKPQTEVVLANSAFAIQCFEQNKCIEDCVAIARESLESGNAIQSFKKLMEVCQ